MTSHLSSHLNKSNNDSSLLSYVKSGYNIETMLDIGCGIGGMSAIAEQNEIEWNGIDKDQDLKVSNKNFKLFDFRSGKLNIYKEYDLIWSIEFLEHLEEKFLDNVMPLFELGQIIIISTPPPGTPGIHHVNCRDKEYWIEKFKEYGLIYSKKLTNEFKKKSNMRKNFFKKNGFVFLNSNSKKFKLPSICDNKYLKSEWKSNTKHNLDDLNQSIKKKNINFEDVKHNVLKILDYDANSPVETEEELESKKIWFERLAKYIEYLNKSESKQFKDFFTFLLPYNKADILKLNKKGFFLKNLKVNELVNYFSGEIDKLKKVKNPDENNLHSLRLTEEQINYLNNIFKNNKILNTLSRYKKKFIKIQSGILHLSRAREQHHNRFLKDINPTNDYVNLHMDPKRDIKCIVYLEKVTKLNGPFYVLPKTNKIKINNLEDFFSRVTSVGNYCENSHQRRFIFRMPRELRFSSNIGKLIDENSNLYSHIKENSFTFISNKYNSIIFDAGNVFHNGGLIYEGERLNLQLIIR